MCSLGSIKFLFLFPILSYGYIIGQTKQTKGHLKISYGSVVGKKNHFPLMTAAILEFTKTKSQRFIYI